MRFLDGRDPLSISDFSAPNSSRDVVEIILLQQALHLGGNKKPYRIIESKSSYVTIERLHKGSALLTGTSVWKSMFVVQDDLDFSSPVINDGQFEVGIYTQQTNEKMLTVENLQQLQARSAVSNRIWTVDWLTLQALKINKVWHTDKWLSMVRMVNNKHADFLLSPFQSNADLSLNIDGIKLVTVPNIKVALYGTRHFAVSKKAKGSKLILQQLNDGIMQLQANGIIEKAYRQAGFFNEQVENWQRLN